MDLKALRTNKMRARRLFAIPLALLTAALTGCEYNSHSTALEACLAKAADSEMVGACRFLFDDWKTLNPHGLKENVVPFKAIAVALVLDREVPATDEDAIDLRAQSEHLMREFFERQGLFYPEEIANLKDKGMEHAISENPDHFPMGVASGTVRAGGGKVSGGVFSCASCHGGRLYDEAGRPTKKAWLGLGNSSYNVGSLIDELYANLNKIVDQWPKFMQMYKRIYGVKNLDPEIIGLKLSRKALAAKMTELRKTLGSFRPYNSGSPGVTNGIAAVEYNLGIYKNPRTPNPDDNAVASAPVLFKRYFRTSFLIDGVYAPEGQPRQRPVSAEEVASPAARDRRIWDVARTATIFTIGTVGTSEKKAARLNDPVFETLKFIQTRSAPKFPGHIDMQLAARGRNIYEGQCASCHGDYSGPATAPQLASFPNKLVPIEKIGTDRLRIDRLDDPEAIAKLSALKVARGVEIRPNKGYVAPMLEGLWATAPYLHNGSVPTLWHLMHPESRPKVFKTGGHALDYVKMGIDYPTGYTPFMPTYTYDTAKAGQGNQGHEAPFTTMTETEKSELLEFLKLL